MAKFILGSTIRKVADRNAWLRKLLWFFDLVFIGGLVKLLGLLPIDTASALGRRLGRTLGPLMPRKSAKIRENLQHVFPLKSTAEINTLVADVWGSSGAVLAEYAHLDHLSRPQNGRLHIEIVEPVATYTDPSTPAVFVTAHLSNWELVASAIAGFGIDFVSLYSPPHNPWLDGMLKKSRKALGCELLNRDESMRPLVRAISQRRSVAMVVDRRIDEGEAVPFFGCDKLTSILPARLALKFQCPLVPVRVERLGGANFRVTFYPPLTPRCTTAPEAEQAIDMMAQVNNHFESWIRLDPGEWFCSKRVWPKVGKDITVAGY